MPDLMMCKNQMCSLSKYCYRFTASAGKHWQSYFYFKDVTKEKLSLFKNNLYLYSGCKFYIANSYIYKKYESLINLK
jgi:hypothetical protein